MNEEVLHAFHFLSGLQRLSDLPKPARYRNSDDLLTNTWYEKT